MRQDADDDRQGSVLVLSLGASARLAAHLQGLALRPAAMTVIDPAPVSRHLHALAQTVTPTLIEGVPAQAEGSVELICYSLPGLCSLAPATGLLRDLYPNLSERARKDVATLDLAALTPPLADLPAPLTLVIDAPGHEMPLLTLLAEQGLLERATALSLRCAAEACFEGAVGAPDLCAMIEDQMFDQVALDADDPDWPVYRFRTSPMRRRIAELEAELAEAREALDARIAEDDGRVAGLRAEAMTLSERVVDLEGQIEARTRERDAARAEESRLREALAQIQPQPDATQPGDGSDAPGQ
ncbi:MAG: hypothetical protein KJZ59_00290 [Pararhodobacter sp.]|nr:hypothetical protein [Pararhodobacter sp.]